MQKRINNNRISLVCLVVFRPATCGVVVPRNTSMQPIAMLIDASELAIPDCLGLEPSLTGPFFRVDDAISYRLP